MANKDASIEEGLRRNAALYFSGDMGRVQAKFVRKETSAYMASLFARPRRLRAKFVIMTRGRSGSGLLVDLLNTHPEIGCRSELLHDRMIFPRAYLKAKERLAKRQVFGFKLLSYQLIGVQKIESGAGFMQDLVNDGYQIVYLWRRNILRQVLSLLYAAERSAFHVHAGEAVNTQRIHVDPAIVISWMKFSETLARWERSTIADFPYIEINYEDDLSRDDTQTRTIGRITAALGVDGIAADTSLKRSTPREIDRFVENADELRSSLAGTPYEQYLHSAGGASNHA